MQAEKLVPPYPVLVLASFVQYESSFDQYESSFGQYESSVLSYLALVLHLLNTGRDVVRLNAFHQRCYKLRSLGN